MQIKKLLVAAAVATSATAQNSSATLTSALSSNNSTLSSLATYIQLVPGLLTQLNNATNVTLLAPSNAAFAKFLNSTAGKTLANNTALIQPLLQYHILNGTYNASSITTTPSFIHSSLTNTTYSNVTGGQVVEAVKSGSNTVFYSGLLSNATVTTANVAFRGGLIHVIDTVLTLPANISTTAVAANLTSAYGALNQTGLLTSLNQRPNVTVFLPANSGFQSIGSALMNLSTSALTSILNYHVLNNTLGYSSSLKNMTVQSAQGNNLTIRIVNGTYYVNSAKVITPNLLVANGVVHVIDNVLNPNNTGAMPNTTISTQTPAFSGASSAAAVPFTSGVATPSTRLATATGSATAASTTAAGASSSSSKAGAEPMKTAAVGAAALFGAGAAFFNM